jgi:hypothetical protein
MKGGHTSICVLLSIHTIHSIVSPLRFIHVSMIATTVIHFMLWSARIKEIMENMITNIMYILQCLQWLWIPTQMNQLSNPQFFVLPSEDILFFLRDSVTNMFINKLINVFNIMETLKLSVTTFYLQSGSYIYEYNMLDFGLVVSVTRM